MLKLIINDEKRYAFARANNVLLIDEFDLINKDLALYRAFNSTGFRARLDHTVTTFDATWTITVKDGKASRGGILGHHDRAKGVVALLKRFVHHVPDLTMAYNGHDGARIPVAWEERNRLEELGKAGKCTSPSKYYFGEGIDQAENDDDRR
jgi:hypothetical protein